MTWRHPFLWVLGLFAGGAAGASFGGGGGGGDHARPRMDGTHLSGVDFGPEAMMAWATGHVGMIVGIAALLVLVVLTLLVVSLIAQGGMAGATAELATGRPSSFGRAWRAGVHLFWRYAGLWLLLLAAVTLVGV